MHIVIPNFKLEEFTNQIIKEGGNSYAIFELKPNLKLQTQIRSFVVL